MGEWMVLHRPVVSAGLYTSDDSDACRRGADTGSEFKYYFPSF